VRKLLIALTAFSAPPVSALLAVSAAPLSIPGPYGSLAGNACRPTSPSRSRIAFATRRIAVQRGDTHWHVLSYLWTLP
jgi:hypothetical protein